MSMDYLLKETYNKVRKVTGNDMRTLHGFKSTLVKPEHFAVYAKTLAEGLNAEDRVNFLKLAKATRRGLMENSMYQLNPHETLTLPILRNFYPKLIAKELVNIMPIDKPDVVKAFVKPKFKKMIADATGASYSGFDYSFPSVGTDISRGPQWGYSGVADATGNTTDILAEMGIDASLPSHLEKDFEIVGVVDSTGGVTTVSVMPTVDSKFSFASTAAGDDAQISGRVDFYNGILYWSSDNADVAALRYKATASLEENSMNPTVKFDMDKIRFTVVDRKISAEWSINIEQDAKALFDITLQSELINIIGEQIALDVDREIVSALITANATQNPGSHSVTFYKKFNPAKFLLGPKGWIEEALVPKLNQLSAQVYESTYMGSANTIAVNPLDAALFESLNGFEYVGDSAAGGEVGYKSATVQAGKYKILVSSVVPQGSAIVKYRSDDLARAAFVYAPYVPALLVPYPLGANPTLTIMTRYATKMIRPNALSVLTISNGVDPDYAL